MKNQHIERLIASSKAYKRKHRYDSRWDHKLGVKVYHVYDDVREKGYWDDVAFKRGSQFVYVFWTHPRYTYECECNDVAYDTLVTEGAFQRSSSFLDRSTPIYRYVGKNKKRKRVSLWEVHPMPASEAAVYSRWGDLHREVMMNGSVVIQPSFKVTQMGHGRAVHVCCPIEVVNVESLVELANFVKRCLDDHTLFSRTYDDWYAYGAEDWRSEQGIENE